MRDNGDDAFGAPLDRVDRLVPVSSVPLPSSTSLTLSSILPVAPSSSSPSSSSTTSSTALDAFIRSVHVGLNSGLSIDTLIANVHLIAQERAENSSRPIEIDEFLSQ